MTLTRVDASGVAGTFDLIFQNDHLTGSFDAPSCTAPGESTCR